MAVFRREALARRGRATYQHVIDAPAYLVAEIVDGALHTHPRPVPAHGKRPPSSLENATHRSTAAAGARADGGSTSSPSCTSAATSSCRTSRAGAANACQHSPTPPTSPSPRTGPARCFRPQYAESTTRKNVLSTPTKAFCTCGLLHPADRILEAFELRDGGWVLNATAKDDAPVTVRPFDASTFSLGDLWA